MLEIGSVVTAKVLSIEAYGLFAKSGDDDIFVDHGEFSWRNQPDRVACLSESDAIEVRVLRLAYAKGLYACSIKRVNPDDSPYRQLSRLPIGTILKGKAVRIMGKRMCVDLDNGAFGFIDSPHTTMLDRSFPFDVDVVIAALEVDTCQLLLVPASTIRMQTSITSAGASLP